MLHCILARFEHLLSQLVFFGIDNKTLFPLRLTFLVHRVVALFLADDVTVGGGEFVCKVSVDSSTRELTVDVEERRIQEIRQMTSLSTLSKQHSLTPTHSGQ